MTGCRIFLRRDWGKTVERETAQLKLSWLNQDQSRIKKPFDELEYSDIFIPLARWLINRILKHEQNAANSNTFVLPYIVGVTGSVSVGKTSFCNQLKEILSLFFGSMSVDIVSTDCFLYPNRILSKMGLENKKGFPQSYDQKRFSIFLSDLRRGDSQIFLPIYSHENYDIDFDHCRVIKNRPAVIILEGINLFLNRFERFRPNSIIYLDAEESSIRSWFIERILDLRDKSFNEPNSYFHYFRNFSQEKMVQFSMKVWREVNLPNLIENILPNRSIADIVLHKSVTHRIDYVIL